MNILDQRIEEVRLQTQSWPGLTVNSDQRSEIPKEGAQNFTDHNSVTRMMRMDIPKFVGTDPDGWVFRIGAFFNFHNTPAAMRLQIAAFHMEGRAAAWFQWMQGNNLLTTWDEFLVNLKHRFDTTIYEDHQDKLSKLTQTTSVAEFQAAFEN